MSRNVILYISVSLDGFIADQNGNVDWIEGEDKNYIGDYGYADFIRNIDTVIMGYNTYRQITEILSPNEWVYKGLKSYVFTSKEYKDTDDIKFINEDIVSFLEIHKKNDGKDIWICGGADITNQCIKCDVIDEYHITTVPVILGKGIRLFNEDNPLIKLVLKSTKQENGLVENVYIRKRCCYE